MPANTRISARATAAAPRRSKASARPVSGGAPRALSRKQQRRGNAQREFAGAAAATKGGGGDSAPADDTAEADDAAVSRRPSKRALREEWHRRMHARAPGGYEPEQEEEQDEVLAPELIAAGALAPAQASAAPWYKFW